MLNIDGVVNGNYRVNLAGLIQPFYEIIQKFYYIL